MLDDDLARVTVSLLRRAGVMCPRRLAHEHGSGRKLSPLGEAGFEVTNRVVEDAILWHKGGVRSGGRTQAFPRPGDLAHEQVALYDAVARGYRAFFADDVAEVADLGWSTDVPELGVRLVGPVGIPVVRAGGTREVRALRPGRRDPLLDEVDLQFAVLRLRAWTDATVAIVALDPLDLRSVEYTVDVGARAGPATAWLEARLETIRTRADTKRAVAGGDCRDCPCIPGCPQLTKAS